MDKVDKLACDVSRLSRELEGVMALIGVTRVIHKRPTGMIPDISFDETELTIRSGDKVERVNV